MVWLDWCAFKDRAFPRVICSSGEREPKSLADLDGSSRQKPASGPLSDYSGYLVLFRKRDNHFSRTRGVAVHKQDDLSMKRLFPQPFSLKHDGLLCNHWGPDWQAQPPQSLRRWRNP